MKSTANIRREPKLFARWQQRCGLSLSVLQRLVVFVTDRVSEQTSAVNIVRLFVRLFVFTLSLTFHLDFPRLLARA